MTELLDSIDTGEVEAEPGLGSDEAKQAIRRRDEVLSEVIRRYYDHPTIYGRTTDYFQPRAQEELSLLSGRRLDQDMGQYELLSTDDERRLFADLDRSYSLFKRLGGVNASTDDELEVFLQGTAAHHMLVTSNLRFVRARAAAAMRSHDLHGLQLPDLIIEGSIGLAKAIRRFDASRGFTFLSFAEWWIDQSIGRAINNTDRMVRVPVWMNTELSRHARIVDTLTTEHGQAPMLEDVAEAYENGLSPDRYEELQRVRGLVPESLEKKLEADEADELLDIVADPNTARRNEQTKISEMVQWLLDSTSMTERERQIIGLRFGLGEPAELTQLQVGEILNVTHQRVQQLQKIALDKLRDSLGRLPKELAS